MDNKLTVKFATYANALPPQRIRLEKPGWAGDERKMVDGSEPQPWHCLPFVEAATYGLELVYPYETECHVVNDGGKVRFEFDYANEPGGILTGGEFITFFPKPPEKFYLFNARVDLVAPVAATPTAAAAARKGALPCSSAKSSASRSARSGRTSCDRC